MYLVPVTALVSLWIAIAAAGPWGLVLPKGDLDSLRLMVRNWDYKAVDPDTLPFKDNSPDPEARRRKECAGCMWQILMLQIDEYWPAGTRLFQENVRRNIPNKNGQWVTRDLIAWAYRGKSSRHILESNTDNLASYCSNLMGVFPWDAQKCRSTDWDQSLQRTYDTQNRVLVGSSAHKPEEEENGRRRTSTDPKDGETNLFQGLRVSKEQLAGFGSQVWKSAQEAPRMVDGMRKAAAAGVFRPSRARIPVRVPVLS